MTNLLVNGQAASNTAQLIASDDRGFNYGDGLFETMLYRAGVVRLLDAHLLRMRTGCERLGIDYPGESLLRGEIETLCRAAQDAVIKLVLTRGRGGRGYRPVPNMQVTRVISMHPLPASRLDLQVAVRWCDTRLGRNAALAGIKHLNRLEQVLAQQEWDDPLIPESLMLDTEGEVVCGTMSNVFIVSEGVLMTPDLRFCGVRGVMRGEVLRAAGERRIPVSEEPLWPDDVATADEVFITNAVHGIRGVIQLADKRWSTGPVTQRLRDAVNA